MDAALTPVEEFRRAPVVPWTIAFVVLAVAVSAAAIVDLRFAR